MPPILVLLFPPIKTRGQSVPDYTPRSSRGTNGKSAIAVPAIRPAHQGPGRHVGVVEERPRPCQINAGHKAVPASDIPQNDIPQELFPLEGNPAEIPVKLHLRMDITIFIRLCGGNLLRWNRKSRSLPNGPQQAPGRFFIRISVDPQKIRHHWKFLVDCSGPVQRPPNICRVNSQPRRASVQIDRLLPSNRKPDAHRGMVEQRVFQPLHTQAGDSFLKFFCQHIVTSILVPSLKVVDGADNFRHIHRRADVGQNVLHSLVGHRTLVQSGTCSPRLCGPPSSAF